jgi:hypothetical protein
MASFRKSYHGENQERLEIGLKNANYTSRLSAEGSTSSWAGTSPLIPTWGAPFSSAITRFLRIAGSDSMLCERFLEVDMEERKRLKSQLCHGHVTFISRVGGGLGATAFSLLPPAYSGILNLIDSSNSTISQSALLPSPICVSTQVKSNACIGSVKKMFRWANNEVHLLEDRHWLIYGGRTSVRFQSLL